MRYLKRFNENLTTELTYKMIDELRSFSRNYLVYLMDDGFAVQVTPSFKSSECHITIHKNYSSFSWGEIKDSMIPFLHMLNRSYDIVSIYDTNQQSTVALERGEKPMRTITGKLDSTLNDGIDDDIMMFKLGIVVNFKDQVVKEAKEDWVRNFSDEDFKEFCDGYLAYLYDDGFVPLYTTQNVLFKKNILMLRKEEESGDGSGVLDVKTFHWDEISDKFVPFFEILNKYYPISKIRVMSKESIYTSPFEKKTKQILFNSDKRDNHGFPLDDFLVIMPKNNAITIDEIVIEVQNLGEL